jgi:hypothetical protein
MKLKQKDYVKKRKENIKSEPEKEISLDEQIELFAETLIDHYLTLPNENDED